jgi:hypothetical protein
MNQGGRRILVIDGPGEVYGGTTGGIDYDTLEFQARDAERFDAAPILDLALHKAFNIGGGERYRVKVMFDMFNVLNTNTILDYSSDNLNRTAFTAPTQILPPRVFRIGATFNF